MLSLRGEKGFFDDVKKGVDIALRSLTEETGYEIEAGDVDPIKLNKLAYFVIQDFDEVQGITYGWYKYGPAPDYGKKQYDDEIEDPDPRDAEEVPGSGRSFVGPDYPGPEAIADYLLEDLDWFEHIISTPTKEFLVEFYGNHGPREPENFRDLYKESAILQQSLDTIKEDDGWINHADTLHDEVSERMNTVNRELLNLTTTEEARNDFREYSRVLNNILVHSIDKESLTASHQSFIEDVINFYYGYAWKYVALLISQATASGRHEDQLRNSIEANLSEMRAQYDNELSSIIDDARRYDLYPEVPDLPDEDISQRETIEDVGVRKWSKAGIESFEQQMRADTEEQTQ